MNNNLYEVLDLSGIDAIVASRHDKPKEILGPHKTGNGILIQTFYPDAVSVAVHAGKKKYEAVKVREEGYFACLLPLKRIPDYRLEVAYDGGFSCVMHDPYAVAPQIPEKELERFNHGVQYKIYDFLGAHKKTVDGTEGVLFAVWAPNALRVSVVGDFNFWDGRRHPMQRRGDSGVFELFIPRLDAGVIYKYELRSQDGQTYCKSDPYANYCEIRPNNASVVADLDSYVWHDAKWMERRKKTDLRKEPVFIYEVHAGSFRKPEFFDGEFYNYRELAVLLAEHVKKMGYTHIELMPIMEHPYDPSWGYQTTGYYAPTSRYGTPEDFMYFMDYMHQQEIGVILDWVPAHFPKDAFGPAAFDGTCLYEHHDKRLGEHPHWGTLIFNYGRAEVANFLIGSALFWKEKYHADGIRMDAVASMLYLDYGRESSEWVPNIYGGHDNLEAIDFLRHLNTVYTKDGDGSVLIAEESTAWPKVTGEIAEDGLGFEYKWNMGWMHDFTEYMKQDPLFRKGCHGMLTFSMIYAYSERFILALSHDEVVHEKRSLLNKMPGEKVDKMANLRAAYGFMVTHPGKKLLFMGQDFAQEREWSEARELDWDLTLRKDHAEMMDYLADLIQLYRKYPALYTLDYEEEGFEWLSCLDADHSMISFLRRGEGNAQDLMVICNFTPNSYQNYSMGVPYPGRYKEIFNSDKLCYGGTQNINPRIKNSVKRPTDGRENSIAVNIPPLGIAVFACTPAEQK